MPNKLPGFNLQDALDRVGGNQEFLAKLLKHFIETNAEFAEKLESLLFEQRHSEAAQLLHRFRGGAATLGAVLLMETAKQLEAEIVSGGFLASQQSFLQSLNETLRIIEHFLSNQRGNRFETGS
jgi:HPt (histidine-containing phosphotransfer) domain-containing protein